MRLFLPLLASLATCTLAAQRIPVRGSVELDDGSPWAGARITLLHRPVAAEVGLGIEDRIEAESDEDGRFVVEVIPGRLYSAWAVGESEKGVTGSWIVDGFAYGHRLELRAIGPPVPKVRIAVTGLAPWRELGGDVEVRVRSEAETSDVQALTLDRADEAELPPLPGLHAQFEVLHEGVPLLTDRCMVELRGEALHTVDVPAPRRVRFDLTDPAGAPAAEVEVFLGERFPVRDVYRSIARSDASGRAIATLPIGTGAVRSSLHYPLLFRAEGWESLQSVFSLSVPAPGDPDDLARVSIVMQPATPWQRTLTLRGKPVVGLPVLFYTTCKSAGGPGMMPSVWRQTTDAAGELVCQPGMPNRIAVIAVPSEEVLGSFAREGWPVHPAVLMATAGSSPGPAAFALEQLVPVDVQVLGPAGAPASGARVVLGEEAQGVLGEIACDHAGRVRLLAVPGLDLAVAGWTDGASGRAKFTTKDRSGPVDLELRTQAVEGVRIAVVNGDEEPAGAARLRVNYYPDGNDSTLLWWGNRGRNVVEDADGAFHVPRYPGMHLLVQSVWIGGRHLRVRHQLRPEEDAGEELVVEVDPR